MKCLGFLLILAAATSAAAVNLPADRAPAAMNSIRAGLWTIEAKGHLSHALCIGDPRLLLQVEHGQASCSRLIEEDKPSRAIVHYSCPGAGWGRTSLVVESAELVHIDTQGIAANAPFAYTADARRTGDCLVRH